MDLNRLTQKSQEAIQNAQTKAINYGNTEIDTDHLLASLLEQENGLVPRLLESTDQASTDRLVNLQKQIADLKGKMTSMRSQWENEKKAIHHVGSLRKELEQTHQQIEKAEREYDLNKAAELNSGVSLRWKRK